MLKIGNAIGKTAVLESLNILIILFKLLFLTSFSTLSYYHDKETVLKVACYILTGDCVVDPYQRKEELSVKDRKQRRRMRIDFERANLEEFSR